MQYRLVCIHIYMVYEEAEGYIFGATSTPLMFHSPAQIILWNLGMPVAFSGVKPAILGIQTKSLFTNRLVHMTGN